MAAPELSQTISQMRDYVQLKVVAGFDPLSEIIASAVDVFCDDAAPEVLKPLAEQFTRQAATQHLESQSSWPTVTDCDRLDRAFSKLNRNGIVCRQNFSCCGNCGVAEIGDEIEAERERGLHVRGYAFYHMQDTESAAEGQGVYLNYGAIEESEEASLRIGHEIVEVLQRHGLETRWNGSWDTRIHVSLDWKRRRMD